jgi:hypothetical protein
MDVESTSRASQVIGERLTDRPERVVMDRKGCRSTPDHPAARVRLEEEGRGRADGSPLRPAGLRVGPRSGPESNGDGLWCSREEPTGPM